MKKTCSVGCVHTSRASSAGKRVAVEVKENAVEAVGRQDVVLSV